MIPVVHVLDTRQLSRPGIIASTALSTSDGIALFDTGPESTFENIATELRNLGAAANDVRHVFLSHIHLDHAGAAWRWAELGATVYVHGRGARHLVDPSKLVESATRIFGADMQKLWGNIAPVAQERVRIVADGEVIAIGSVDVRAIETPGHAKHHHVYAWDDALFGGDVAGVRLGPGPPIPPFVPPELDVESWLRSLDKIRAINPARLYLPHFGLAAGSVTSHLDSLEERVRRWSTWFREQMIDMEREANLIPLFAEYEAKDIREGGGDDDLVADYEAADPSYMAVTAALRYWRKSHGT